MTIEIQKTPLNESRVERLSFDDLEAAISRIASLEPEERVAEIDRFTKKVIANSFSLEDSTGALTFSIDTLNSLQTESLYQGVPFAVIHGINQFLSEALSIAVTELKAEFSQADSDEEIS